MSEALNIVEIDALKVLINILFVKKNDNKLSEKKFERTYNQKF
jgi:hypothetical protein